MKKQDGHPKRMGGRITLVAGAAIGKKGEKRMLSPKLKGSIVPRAQVFKELGERERKARYEKSLAHWRKKMKPRIDAIEASRPRKVYPYIIGG